MKRLLILALIFIISKQSFAQNAVNYDKEKLLEFYQSQRYADAAQYLKLFIQKIFRILKY